MDPSWDLKRWHKNVHTVDSPVTDSKDTNHRSLKSRILSLYGGDVWSEILLLERFRVRIARRAAVSKAAHLLSSFISPDDGSHLGFETFGIKMIILWVLR